MSEDKKREPVCECIEDVLRQLAPTFQNPVGAVGKVILPERANRNRDSELRGHTYNDVILPCSGLNKRNLSKNDIKNLQHILSIAIAGNVNSPGYRYIFDSIVVTVQDIFSKITFSSRRTAEFDDNTHVIFAEGVYLLLLKNYRGIKAGTKCRVRLDKRNFMSLHVAVTDSTNAYTNSVELGFLGDVIPCDIFEIIPRPHKTLFDIRGEKKHSYARDDWRKEFAKIFNGTSNEVEDVCNQRNTTMLTTRNKAEQDKFRKKLFLIYGSECAVMGKMNGAVLEAAHIKPWCDAEDPEAFNLDNGILFNVLIHDYFDSYLISYADDGKMIASKEFIWNPAISGIGMPIQEKWLTLERRAYLALHRAEFEKIESRR